MSTHLFGSIDNNCMHILVFRDRTEEENVETEDGVRIELKRPAS